MLQYLIRRCVHTRSKSNEIINTLRIFLRWSAANAMVEDMQRIGPVKGIGLRMNRKRNTIRPCWTLFVNKLMMSRRVCYVIIALSPTSGLVYSSTPYNSNYDRH